MPHEGIMTSPVLFAGGNLSPISLPLATQINPVLTTYNRYMYQSQWTQHQCQKVDSTLHLLLSRTYQNIKKGFDTPEMVQHLGMELQIIWTLCSENHSKRLTWKPSNSTIDILHRAALINPAMIPLYNNVRMALPATYKQRSSTSIQGSPPFLWTKTIYMENIWKRRLLARKWLSASFGKGRLQIQHLEETTDGLHINLIQKYHQKMEQGILTYKVCSPT